MLEYEYLKIIAAILYQEGGQYKLKQESIDVIKEPFSVSIPDEPLRLNSSYGTLAFLPLSLNLEED